MKTLLSTVALIAATTTVQAASITVNESAAPGGDYADALGATGNNLGAAPQGTTNVVVHGDLRCAQAPLCSGGLDDVFDAFYFDVATNAAITNLSLGVFPSLPLSTLELTAQLIDTSDGSVVFDTTFGAPNSINSVTLVGGGTPIGPGNYNFALFFTDLPSVDVGMVNYSLSSTIVDTTPSPVPVPAAMPLLLAGLGGLAWVGRRRKQSAA